MTTYLLQVTFIPKGVDEAIKMSDNAQKETGTSVAKMKRMEERATKLGAAVEKYGNALIAVDKKL